MGCDGVSRLALRSCRVLCLTQLDLSSDCLAVLDALLPNRKAAASWAE